MDEGKSIRELMNRFIDDLPNKMTNDDVSLIILTLLMTYEKHNSWLEMQDNITLNMVAFLEQPHDKAIQDANKFLEDIVNGV